MRAWRFYGIGEETPISTSNWNGAENTAHVKLPVISEYESRNILQAQGARSQRHPSSNHNHRRTVQNYWSSVNCRITARHRGHNICYLVPDEHQVDYKGDDDEIAAAPKLYECPEETCTATFLRRGNLERHEQLGIHQHVPLRQTLRDYSLQTFRNRLENIDVSYTLPIVGDALKELSHSTNEGTEILPLGWALRQRAKTTRFTDKVHNYLRKCFNVGLQTGKKLDPAVVEKKMKEEMIGSEKLFRPAEQLTSKQIASVFSRMASTNRNNPMPVPDTESADNLPEDLIITAADEDDALKDPMFEGEFEEVLEAVKEKRNEIFIPS